MPAKILYYHRIGIPSNGRKQRLTVWPDRFKRQMNFLSQMGYQTLSMDEFTDAVTSGHIPPKKFIITFDDGFLDLYEHAYPVLKKNNFKAIIYVLAEKEKSEWAKALELPAFKLLSWDLIKELSDNGIEIGSHTCTHPDLSVLTDKEMEREIIRSKEIIEDKIGKPVHHFCYPFGRFNLKTKEILKQAGYLTSCTTQKGQNFSDCDLFELNRIVVGKSMNMLRFIIEFMVKPGLRHTFNLEKG